MPLLVQGSIACKHQFTCFTSTNVQILTSEELQRKQERGRRALPLLTEPLPLIIKPLPPLTKPLTSEELQRKQERGCEQDSLLSQKLVLALLALLVCNSTNTDAKESAQAEAARIRSDAQENARQIVLEARYSALLVQQHLLY